MSKEYEYHSIFADDIRSFIDFKRALGFSSSSYDKFMYSFDGFCVENSVRENLLTNALADAWLIPKPREKANGVKRRMAALRQFGKYLTLSGKNAYIIPSEMIGSYYPFTPYIYSNRELQAFFDAADNLAPTKQSPFREYVVPVMFRVQYCCGLRPSELRLMRNADLDHDSGILRIQNSKNHRDRNVVLSNDLLLLCRKYDQRISVELPGREYYFEHPTKGGAYGMGWIQRQFKICWRNANIEFCDKRKPRVYDARHNYATRVMSKWMQDGKDISTLLPSLSEYMGHSSLENTAYYIHLLPERIDTTAFTGWDDSTSIIPKVPCYED
jgi:integrase